MEFHITKEDGQFLVDLARKTITSYVTSQQVIAVPPETPLHLQQPCGVFVTLSTRRGDEKMLRGCIGYPEPRLPLVEATITASISAATRDPRFPPVSVPELAGIMLEVSVLTPPEVLNVNKASAYPQYVQVGRDGLIVERGIHKGLLLPQVPVEWEWDAEEFLANCCVKAGLLPDAWLLPGTKIYRFSCILAREESPRAPITLIDMRL